MRIKGKLYIDNVKLSLDENSRLNKDTLENELYDSLKRKYDKITVEE